MNTHTIRWCITREKATCCCRIGCERSTEWNRFENLLTRRRRRRLRRPQRTNDACVFESVYYLYGRRVYSVTHSNTKTTLRMALRIDFYREYSTLTTAPHVPSCVNRVTEMHFVLFIAVLKPDNIVEEKRKKTTSKQKYKNKRKT